MYKEMIKTTAVILCSNCHDEIEGGSCSNCGTPFEHGGRVYCDGSEQHICEECYTDEEDSDE
jgi:predicted amidophosphoribosyltransferase